MYTCMSKHTNTHVKVLVGISKLGFRTKFFRVPRNHSFHKMIYRGLGVVRFIFLCFPFPTKAQTSCTILHGLHLLKASQLQLACFCKGGSDLVFWIRPCISGYEQTWWIHFLDPPRGLGRRWLHVAQLPEVLHVDGLPRSSTNVLCFETIPNAETCPQSAQSRDP